MTVSAVQSQPAALVPMSAPPIAMSRPQVGIERLPTRRMSNEPRESMNCKSCRKRKIKCNRLRPSCEACQVFQCPCIYDAVPKKRGPKTDVLEALLKRVDGLEQQLKDKKSSKSSRSKDDVSSAQSDSSTSPADDKTPTGSTTAGETPTPTPTPISSSKPAKRRSHTHAAPSDVSSTTTTTTTTGVEGSEMYPSPRSSRDQHAAVQTEAMLDTYFRRLHGKPFNILDEAPFRQQLQLHHIPTYLLNAVCGLASRSTPHPNGYQAAVSLGEEYARRARAEVEMDEPSIEGLQTLLLLTLSFNASGKGKKAYMLLTSAIGMALALELHREADAHVRMMPAEREMRRRLFWSCYLLDRFMACGSRRPSLISDRSILLRLPSWSPSPSALAVEGDFFQNASNLQYHQGSGGGKKSQGSSGMLIDITRILGITNRYMAAGGVKGDSHFPWHSLSNLSKIRQDLDVWASGSQAIFSSVESLFSQPDSTALILSKLVYHLIHCLIYRPFLPVDLAELAGTGQHQSWQIEATNMCFLHANAVAELVELGKQMPEVEWPGFVGYCICTAGTVHIHGAHYTKSAGVGEMSVFASSAEFLSREMQLLNELRYAWAVVQHHRQTLQTIYNTHTELVKSLATNPMRYTSVFHLDDFFDRYANITGPASLSSNFDAANLSLADIVVDYGTNQYVGHDLYLSKMNLNGVDPDRPSLKRKLASFSKADPPPQPYSSFLSSPMPHSLHGSAGNAGNTGNVVDHAHGEPTALGSFSLPAHPAKQPAPVPPFSPAFDFSTLTGTPATATAGTGDVPPRSHGASGPGDLAGYDPMFGLQDHVFSSPSPWPAEENGKATASATANAAATGTLHSPGAHSNDGSTGGTVAGEEKDPFLSLLEQLAETEYARGPGNELDFFLSGTPRPA